MGVVWSKAGPVAAGTLVTGVAAGLLPRTVNWPTTPTNEEQTYETSSRPLENTWATTLAADLAQTALLKRKGQVM